MTSSGFAGNPLCHREERSLRSDAAISAIALVLPLTVVQGLSLRLLHRLIGGLLLAGWLLMTDLLSFLK